MAEHNVATDPDLHEMKGASSASSTTIATADGSGSTDWSPFVPANDSITELKLDPTGVSTISTRSVIQYAGGDIAVGWVDVVRFSYDQIGTNTSVELYGKWKASTLNDSKFRIKTSSNTGATFTVPAGSTVTSVGPVLALTTEGNGNIVTLQIDSNDVVTQATAINVYLRTTA